MERRANVRTTGKSSGVPDKIGLGGAVAGFTAGVVMLVLSPILSLLTDFDIWQPPKLISAMVYGSEVVNTVGFQAGPVFTGLAIHLLVSTIMGAIFGIFFNRVFHLTTAFGLSLQVGLAYGILTWIVVYFLVLPFANPTLRASYQAPFVAQHIVYGIVLGAVYMYVRPLPYRYLG